MLKMIKKDIISVKRVIFFMVIYCILFGVLVPGTQYMAPVMAVYMYLVGSMQSEESNHMSELFKSFPVRNRDIVGGKYVMSALVLAASSAFTWLAQYICSRYIPMESSTYTRYTGGGILYMVILSSVMISLTVPLIYRFGFIKMRIIMIFLWIGVAVSMPVILTVTEYVGFNNIVMSGYVVYVVGICASIAMLAVSWKISAGILEKYVG